MKKNILLLTFFLAIISLQAVLSCEDIAYSVSYLGKDTQGCFTGLTFNLYKENCNVSCFKDFDLITFQTNADYSRSFNVTSYSSQISNPFIVVINSLNCSADKPTYEFYADLYGDKNCSLTFRLEEEYQTYLNNLAEEEARITEQQRLLEEKQRLFDEERKKQQELEQSNQQTQLPALAKINGTNDSIVYSDNTTINPASQIDNPHEDPELVKTPSDNTDQFIPADTKEKSQHLIWLIFGLTMIIVLTAIMITLVVVKGKIKVKRARKIKKR